MTRSCTRPSWTIVGARGKRPRCKLVRPRLLPAPLLVAGLSTYSTSTAVQSAAGTNKFASPHRTHLSRERRTLDRPSASPNPHARSASPDQHVSRTVRSSTSLSRDRYVSGCRLLLVVLCWAVWV